MAGLSNAALVGPIGEVLLALCPKRRSRDERPCSRRQPSVLFNTAQRQWISTVSNKQPRVLLDKRHERLNKTLPRPTISRAGKRYCKTPTSKQANTQDQCLSCWSSHDRSKRLALYPKHAARGASPNIAGLKCTHICGSRQETCAVAILICFPPKVLRNAITKKNIKGGPSQAIRPRHCEDILQ